MESVLAVYRWTGHDAPIYSLVVEPRLKKISKYEIDHTCDIKSHCWLTNLIVIRVKTEILSFDNSHHVVPVYNKSYRVVINTR